MPRILVAAPSPDLPGRLEGLFPESDLAHASDVSLTSLTDRAAPDVLFLTSATLSAHDMDDGALLTAFSGLTERWPHTHVILLVEAGHVDLAARAMQSEGIHYTKLPVSDSELRLMVESALARQPRVNSLDSRDGQRRARFHNLIGQSLPMQKIYQQIEQAAATEIPVLLVGETGTGKDLAAQAIHTLSGRKEGPYVPVNLGALPPELVASELFGHEKGAFTGAHQQYKGRFEQANDGTVFLDEIDSMEEKVQVSLLRLIESKRFHRLGGRRAIRTTARLIAATNSHIEDLRDSRSFREDLFYRLDVFRITVPPLRERPSDIPLLADVFATRFKSHLNKPVRDIDPDCFRILERYDWPGNVRELKNVIQRAILVCDGKTLLPRHLPPRFQETPPDDHPTITFTVGTPLDDVERGMILRALAVADNNRTRAAELLGISRRAIYNKLKKHAIP